MRPRGTQGSWFATYNGVEYPCVWETLASGAPMKYRDDGLSKYNQAAPYIEAIKRIKKVILAKRRLAPDGSWRRNGYVALYSIKDVKYEDQVLTFEATDRQDFR